MAVQQWALNRTWLTLTPAHSRLIDFNLIGNSSGQFVFMQNAEPGALFAWDETDGESLGMSDQMFNTLTSPTLEGINPNWLRAGT